MSDPLTEGLMKDVALLKRRVDNLPRPEVPLGLSLITETVLGASAASITFSSIPQGFRHLQVVCQVRTDRAAEIDLALLRFNGDTGANYDEQHYTANDTSITSNGSRGITAIQAGATEAANSRASNFSPLIIDIPNYASSGEKWTFSRSAAFGDVSADTDLFIQNFAGRWRNTAAITSITLLPNVGPNFVSGSRFGLYGVY